MTLSVKEHLEIAEFHQQEANATECRTCGHPYLHHWQGVRCYFPPWPRPGVALCRCPRFVDPALVPPSEQLTLETMNEQNCEAAQFTEAGETLWECTRTDTTLFLTPAGDEVWWCSVHAYWSRSIEAIPAYRVDAPAVRGEDLAPEQE